VILILSNVEHQRRNHSVAPLRRHRGMFGVIADCDYSCSNCESAASY
jgi:hypothetical protein